MSITGSLVGYENNNEVTLSSKKNRSLLNMSGSTKQCSSLNTSISNSVITAASSSLSNINSKHQNNNNECKQHKRKRRIHLNSLWSIWYGILITLLQGYLALHGAYRFLGCYFIQWRGYPPFTELNMQIILCGFVLLVLPLFLISAIIKVGNLANDSIKLATGTGKCSAEPDDGLEEESNGGTLRALWTHGGPTSSFIHIITALCLLLPRLMLEARLIENGNLQRDHIWRTELDFLLNHKDRFVVLSFMTSPYQNISDDFFDENRLDDDLIDNDDSDTSIYDQTHLIESFHPGDIDNIDNFDTHERLEIELTTTKIPIPPATRIRNIMTITPTQPTSIFQHERTLYQQPAATVTTATKTTRLTTTHQHAVTMENHNNNRKHHERIRTGNRQHNKNGGNGNGGGRKHSGGKQQHDNMHRNLHNNKETATSNERDEEPVKSTISSGGGKNNRNYNRKSTSSNVDDFDEKLELKPNHKFEWDKELEMSTVFEVNSSANKRKQSKIVDGNSDDKRKPIDNNNGQSKKLIKDSEIHIVKKEKSLDIGGQSTPFSTDSKIIEIKPAPKTNATTTSRRVKRFPTIAVQFIDEYSDSSSSSDSNDNRYSSAILENPPIHSIMDDVTAAPLINAIVTNVTVMPAIELKGIARCLQTFLGVEKELDLSNWSHLPSLEFVNLVLAITVWSARYPAVFWGTSKAFAIVFSFQLIANGIDIILGYAGASVLYKLQIVGQQLPMPAPPLLLNAVVTISLFLLSTVLIIASSLIIYLYGHGRLAAKIRERKIISTKTDNSWTYFAHCASLCFVLALSVVKAPILHDLSASYRGSLDGAILAAVLGSIVHLFTWIVLWLGLTAKRRWNFKLPPLNAVTTQTTTSAAQPLLVNTAMSSNNRHGGGGRPVNGNKDMIGEDTIYWPKLTPSSPKLKVTFNEIPSTSSDHDLLAEHDGKRNPGRRVSLCLSSPPGEADDGDYATLRGPTGDLLHLSDLEAQCDLADDTSEEGKLLACVRDDSVTYASTRDLEPPNPDPPDSFLVSPQQILSPLAPVTVTVHTNEAHVSSTLTPRCLRRADSGVPTDALLTPRSDTTSTESSTSPPDRALSETSSGVHSGEERDEVVIRPRPIQKSIVKPPPAPAIQEEPFGRSTNMKMSSFNNETGKSSATLPLIRGVPIEHRHDFANHCSTMPLPIGCHQQQHQQFRSQLFGTPTASKSQLHTTLPNGLRYTNSQNAQHFLRRIPHVKNAESPYGILGLGAGHHTFSKLLHDPLMCHNIAEIPEDRDSANYSMISDHDRDMYVNSGNIN